MKLKHILITVIVLLNVGFTLIASYIAYDYNSKIVEDAYDVIKSIKL